MFWQEESLRSSPLVVKRKWRDEKDPVRQIAKILNVALPRDPKESRPDPFLKEKSLEFCHDPNHPKWNGFLSDLRKKAHSLSYWEALVLDCKSESELSLEKFLTVFPKLIETKNYTYAYHSAKTIVRLQKYVGNREGVAQAYVDILKVLRNEDVTPETIGKDDDLDLTYDRINMTLWASRYQALTGNYLDSKVKVQDALQEIRYLFDSVKNMNNKDEERFRELEAEAYHIKAFRISLEEQDFAGAALQNRLGRDIEPLSDNWQARFQWYEGWYQYLQGDNQSAVEHWSKLIDNDIGGWESKALFWTALVHKQNNRSSEFMEARDLLYEKHPLSFYTIYSMSELGWKEFSPVMRKPLEDKLSKWQLDISSIVAVDSLKKLHEKVELTAKIGNRELMAATTKDLYFAMRKKISRNNLEPFLYISRLLLIASEYRLAMSLTYELSIRHEDLWQDFPEQILVLFPFGFEEDVLEVAKNSSLDPFLLLGLIRQESAFQPDATSWVGAKGLLQLMPSTAKQYSEFQYSERKLINKLEEPQFNLSVAGRYLSLLKRRYRGNRFEMCAAYNAGEYVVDRWKAVRPGSDVLIWLENIPFSETQKYVKNVLRNQLMYRSLYGDKVRLSESRPES